MTEIELTAQAAGCLKAIAAHGSEGSPVTAIVRPPELGSPTPDRLRQFIWTKAIVFAFLEPHLLVSAGGQTMSPFGPIPADFSLPTIPTFPTPLGTLGYNSAALSNDVDHLDRMANEAFHGVAGQFVRASDPYHSADPHAVLVNFLAFAGNRLGANCTCTLALGAVERPILYTLIVGRTGTGRKSTSVRIVKTFWSSVESDLPAGVMAGLSTGEGLIAEIRDPNGDVPGVTDKRRVVVLDEFGLLANCMSREGNTTASILKSAFDGQLLQTATKANPAKASNPHIALVACCTPGELAHVFSSGPNKRLGSDGFANRFLYVHSEPERWDPTKSDRLLDAHHINQMQAELSPVGAQLTAILAWARNHRPSEITLHHAAMDEYRSFARRFALHRAEMPPAYAGFLNRGDTQVVRLAMCYAILDRSAEIHVTHLRAAIAVWNYCSASVQRLLPSLLIPATPAHTLNGIPVSAGEFKIHSHLEQEPTHELSVSALNRAFSRNKTVAEITTLCDALVRHGICEWGESFQGERHIRLRSGSPV